MGSGSASALTILLRNSLVIAGPMITLVYPLYASVRAIETKSSADNQQWLTYWILYSIITLFEITFAAILKWIPFWSFAKLVATCWLVLPSFNGAAYVYEQYVKPFSPFFTNNQNLNVWFVPQKCVMPKPTDVVKAAQKYTTVQRSSEFEKHAGKSKKVSRSQSSRMSSQRVFDEVQAGPEYESIHGYYNDIFDSNYKYYT